MTQKRALSLILIHHHFPVSLSCFAYIAGLDSFGWLQGSSSGISPSSKSQTNRQSVNFQSLFQSPRLHSPFGGKGNNRFVRVSLGDLLICVLIDCQVSLSLSLEGVLECETLPLSVSSDLHRLPRVSFFKLSSSHFLVCSSIWLLLLLLLLLYLDYLASYSRSSSFVHSLLATFSLSSHLLSPHRSAFIQLTPLHSLTHSSLARLCNNFHARVPSVLQQHCNCKCPPTRDYMLSPLLSLLVVVHRSWPSSPSCSVVILLHLELFPLLLQSAK